MALKNIYTIMILIIDTKIRLTVFGFTVICKISFQKNTCIMKIIKFHPTSVIPRLENN